MPRGVKLVVLALLVLAAVDAVLSRGKGIPSGSYVDAKSGFSLVPPASWHLLPPERFGPAAAINPALTASLADRQIALVLIGPGEVGRGASSVNVAVVPGADPALAQGDLELVAAPVEAGIAKTFGPFSRNALRKRNVDGLAAVELSGLLAARPGGARVMLTQTIVPGRDKRYLVTFLASPQRQDQDGPAYEALLSSFRVLRRPSPF